MLREFLEDWREAQRKGITLQRVFDEVTATRTELGAHAKQDETRYLETQIALTKLGKNGHGNGDRKSGGMLTKALESEAGKIVSKAIPLVIAALLGWLSHHLALVNPTPPAAAAEQQHVGK